MIMNEERCAILNKILSEIVAENKDVWFRQNGDQYVWYIYRTSDNTLLFTLKDEIIHEWQGDYNQLGFFRPSDKTSADGFSYNAFDAGKDWPKRAIEYFIDTTLNPPVYAPRSSMPDTSTTRVHNQDFQEQKNQAITCIKKCCEFFVQTYNNIEMHGKRYKLRANKVEISSHYNDLNLYVVIEYNSGMLRQYHELATVNLKTTRDNMAFNAYKFSICAGDFTPPDQWSTGYVPVKTHQDDDITSLEGWRVIISREVLQIFKRMTDNSQTPQTTYNALEYKVQLSEQWHAIDRLADILHSLPLERK
jgi:hypothetical protein